MSKNRPRNFSTEVDRKSQEVHLSWLKGLRSRFSPQHLQPPTVFLGLSPSFGLQPGAFSLPVRTWDDESFEKVSSRVTNNLRFFSANYAALVFLLAIVVLAFHPTALVLMVVLALCWWGHFHLLREKVVLTVGNISLNATTRTVGLAVASAFIGVIFCFHYMVRICLISFFAIGIHSLVRNVPNIEKHEESLQETKSKMYKIEDHL
mmetsp:Transcript_17768/g.25925  ORF Transcript_17768/g.25925 Transcript_17768/m.25925 type:complete len:206 (-) Transcript_17768:85-702(-)